MAVPVRHCIYDTYVPFEKSLRNSLHYEAESSGTHTGHGKAARSTTQEITHPNAKRAVPRQFVKPLLWAMQESNLRLPPCEDGTLAAELIALGRRRFSRIDEALQLFNQVRRPA